MKQFISFRYSFFNRQFIDVIRDNVSTQGIFQSVGSLRRTSGNVPNKGSIIKCWLLKSRSRSRLYLLLGLITVTLNWLQSYQVTILSTMYREGSKVLFSIFYKVPRKTIRKFRYLTVVEHPLLKNIRSLIFTGICVTKWEGG